MPGLNKRVARLQKRGLMKIIKDGSKAVGTRTKSMNEEPAMVLGGVGPTGGNGSRFLPPVVSELSRFGGCTFCIISR